MGTEHPTFPNPTIQEALCEIHFRLPDGVEWKPSLFGDFYRYIQSEFPELEPVTQVGVQLQMGPSAISHALLPLQQRMRYKHKSRNLLLQLSADILTVNVLPQYPGWTQMSKDVLNTWNHVREVIKPASIVRIGLRYINRIGRTHPAERAGDWLTSSDYIPKSALESLPGFLSRLQIRKDKRNRLIVTLGDKPGTGDSASEIVLDIDCILEADIRIEDEAILDEINSLHQTAWDIFSSSMTPRLGQSLRGGN